MRRTLLTLAVFIGCATGVGVATDALMPAPPAAVPASTLVQLAPEVDPEPVGRVGIVHPHNVPAAR